MIRHLILPVSLRAMIEETALAAYPRECCGLIEGIFADDVACASAVHATRNAAGENDRFEIDPSDHIRILKALRGTDREIVGCYHSHPNGRAELSPRDRENGSWDNFVWVIAGVRGAPSTEGSKITFAAHVARGGTWHQIDLATDAPLCN